MGRAKLHDKEPGGRGVDEEIVNRLRRILGGLATAGNNTEYAVYIIGSVCGGTCSGAIQDMPAIVRHAFSSTLGGNLKVYGMLYIPDAMVGGMGDATARKAMANGYAALKEINYYQGISVRPGYSVKFPFNDPTCPEIEITKYFDEPMLIGSSMGTVANADKLAQQTVAEYLLNLFTDNQPQNGAGLNRGMTLQSALHNVTGGNFLYHPNSNMTKEMQGEAHDFPYQFGTIGFAKAAAPQKIIIAYAVNSICNLAGIKAEDTVIDVQQGRILPFRSNLFNASEGTLQARQLVEPLAKLLDTIHNGSFNFAADINSDLPADWRKIKAGEYDACKNVASRRADNKTTIVAMEALKKEISTMYQNYVQRVNSFVREYGPLAYVNVYQGNFLKEGDETGTGVKKMLENLMLGYNIDGTDYTMFRSEDETKLELDKSEKVIRETRIVLDFFLHEKATQASEWMNNFNKWVKAQIDEKRHEVAIGVNKYVDDCICKKAANLSDQMEKFGHLLNELAEIYQGFGNCVGTYEEFSRAKDSLCEINLAAGNSQTYSWLKQQVDTQIVGINARGFRDALINDFMANPLEWLSDAEATTQNGSALKNISKPIAARTKFDTFVSNRMGAFTLTVSIKDIFENLNNQGQNLNAVASDVIEQLRAQSTVQFNGNTTTGTKAVVLVIPAALSQGGGAGIQIAQALRAACQPGEMIFESADADGIMMYNCVNELPVYRLNNLKTWEDAYLLDVNNYNRGLHGLSPSAEERYEGNLNFYVDRMPWKDYPAITVANNSQSPNADGEISHEGEIRNEMEGVLREAEKWGIIVYNQSGLGEWTCTRICLDKSRSWEFDIASCGQDENGLLPTGKDLMDEIMTQNGVNVNEISRYKKQIALAGNAILMSGIYQSENMAREYVPRILRSNVDMYLEIRDTLLKFTAEGGWGRMVEEINKNIIKNIRARMYPAMMYRMILAGLLVQNEKKVWQVQLENGKTIVLLNETMSRFLQSIAKNQATTFKGYYLYKTMRQKLGDDGYVELNNYAEKCVTEFMENEEMEVLEANMKVAQMLGEEAEVLKNNGANMDNAGASFTRNFKNFIGAYATSEEEQREILSFYINAVHAITEE